MANEWVPSFWGRRITGSEDWRLRLDGLELSLTMAGQTQRVHVEDAAAYRVHTGLCWTDITFLLEHGRAVKADGLPNAQALALTDALNATLTEKRICDDVSYLQKVHREIDEWLDDKARQEQVTARERRWFTHELQRAVMQARPSIDFNATQSRLNNPDVAARLGGINAKGLTSALVAWQADYGPTWDALNAAHTKRELIDCQDLLRRVESKPLTEEQARAVICFDNRVQVVASAGSGKTSTMVAKAAYAFHRGFVAPERIVLLAFNKQAAEELKERAAKSFERLGMSGVVVETSTFHALGLRIIGKATGEKPDIPEWAIDTVGAFRKLTDIVDRLKDASPLFRTQWDLFRFVFGKDLPSSGSKELVDAWDAQGNGRHRTIKGETVKSREEAMIADWLFYNGVEYVYEQPYKFRTASDEYRQYKPDFYFPGVDLYHEHFALDAKGQAPAHFEGYLEGVQWKRQLHQQKGTALFETTSHGLRNGDDFSRLETALIARGITLDPNPDREIPKSGKKPMEPAELTGLVRTFISHAKSNCLTIPLLRQRLKAMPEDTFKFRHSMFLDIAGPIMDAWDAALASEDGIDFEDMLNQAAEHLESGRYEAHYELVMADEFQDASRARARLCRALVQKPGRYFFAVGDDWQSINRFAGADVSVMTGFREWFGSGQVLKLEQTFRCPQELCDVSSQFVARNPAQIPKRVRSVTSSDQPVLQAFQVDNKAKIAGAINKFLIDLAAEVEHGRVAPGRNGKVSVYVLGRYNADRQYVPTRRAHLERFIDVSFLTIHRSKGSEADYVVLPEMLSVLRGRSFPNDRTDDPVLALAMPSGDDYPLGEERRLFYVALTRARRRVTMFTVRGQCSSFLRELEEDGFVSITDVDGEAIHEESCPVCTHGVLVLRTGPYGEFRSCSNYPACVYKPAKKSPAASMPSQLRSWGFRR